LISCVAVEASILLAASRGNSAVILKEPASYKVDTDSITTKVRQEFAAKENAKMPRDAPVISAVLFRRPYIVSSPAIDLAASCRAAPVARRLTPASVKLGMG
jgi:hypothetical protein